MYGKYYRNEMIIYGFDVLVLFQNMSVVTLEVKFPPTPLTFTNFLRESYHFSTFPA